MIRFFSLLIRDYFGFSRTETRGVFILLAVVSIAIFTTIYIESTAFKTYQDQEADLLILDSLMSELEMAAPPIAVEEAEEEIQELFIFNPNEASFEDFRRLGVSEKLSARILSYRNKGGRFYKPADLMRIYDFPTPLYNELKAYIDLPQTQRTVKTASYTRVNERAMEEAEQAELKEPAQPSEFLLDINHADSVELMQLKGIGTVLSSRIVKYRDQLGGFHSIHQLKEVYHISDAALHTLEASTFIDDGFETKKIKINEVDFKTLLKHPYIDYELAKAIMNHRRIYGNFSSADQLREVYFIKEELLVKLLPYIVI